MGSAASRTEPQDSDLSEGSIPSTPILAPVQRFRRLEELDPRSPSTSIIRTPIDVSTKPSKSPSEDYQCAYN